jgi:lipopolysaccharide transport system permease protein
MVEAALIKGSDDTMFSAGQITPSNDLSLGLRASYVWGALGWHDIRQRYRRSVIGPFWFTLSTAILVAVLGALYSTLLQQEVSEYIPYLAIGLVVWQFIGASLNEGCDTFIGSAYLIKESRMPLTIYASRIAWRNFIILLHSLPVAIIALVAFGRVPGPELFLLPLGLALLLFNAIWVGIVLGALCARFRDVQPIINSLVTVAFFFTPVMWSPEILKDRAWVAELNPFYHIIEIIRAPIIDRPIQLDSWLWAIGTLIVGFLMAQYLMVRTRNRVAYWL